MFDELDDDLSPGGLEDDGFGPLEAGAAYALFRHGQDRQTAQLLRGLGGRGGDESEIHVHVHQEDPEEKAQPVNALDFSTVHMPQEWDEFFGQEPMKKQLAIYIKSAQARNAPLPHVLLASGSPGVGKTAMARLIAKTMGVNIYELVPPFNIHTLVAAARKLGDGDVLFIDEVHKLADSGKRGAEILLKVLEEGVAFMPDGSVIPLADITVIGATTDRDKLPEPVIDRFKIKPYYQPYSWGELGAICIEFAWRHNALDVIDDELAVKIAAASRGTPRIIEEMVMAARDMALAFGAPPTADALLAFR